MSEPIDYSPLRITMTDWQTDHEALGAIRHQVFVIEQQVPVEAEIDDEDPIALHWLALDPQAQPIGTARLVGNRIGRMAVLKTWRHQGVGSGLLRAIIKQALAAGLDTLELHAQTHAVPFYQKFGFVTYGGEFDDAGIPHVAMRLELRRYDRTSPRMPDIDTDLRQRQSLDSQGDFSAAALELVSGAQYALRLFTQRLDPLLYDDDSFCEAVRRLATRHPNAEVRILVCDTSSLQHSHHRLVELFLRLTSRVALRKLNQEDETAHIEFLVTDEAGVLCNQSGEGYRGYCYRHAPQQARQFIQDFDALWHSSEPDPTLRRLYL